MTFKISQRAVVMHLYADMYLIAVYLLRMSSNLLLLYLTDLEMDRVSRSLHLVSMLFQGSNCNYFLGRKDGGDFQLIIFIIPFKLFIEDRKSKTFIFSKL